MLEIEKHLTDNLGRDEKVQGENVSLSLVN